MADRNRIVTLDAAGTATTVLDLNDIATYYTRRDTFQVKPGTVKPVLAERQRRYGGSATVAETQDNGSVAWTAVIKGSTQDDALYRAEVIFQTLRSARRDLFLEWRPGSASYSTFYEIRGPASLTPAYSATMFTGARAWLVDIEVPVAPLAFGTPATYTISSSTLPTVFSLTSPIPGSAPALANVTLRTSGGEFTPVWAMIGWAAQPGTPNVGVSAVAPFGIIEAESGTPTAWGVVSDAAYRGGSGVRVTIPGISTTMLWSKVLDPGTMVADDWTDGEIAVEVWARVQVASTIVSPNYTLYLESASGVGGRQYTAEYGSAGKRAAAPATGSNWFMITKLGTLTFPVDPSASRAGWRMTLEASVIGGGTGLFGLDYLMLVPAQQRALLPTAKPLDSTYPLWVPSTADTQRRVYGADLSGAAASSDGRFGKASGLGGSPIELPAGVPVDMLLKLSSNVPDDPTGPTSSEQLSHTGVTGSVVVRPRYWLTRGV